MKRRKKAPIKKRRTAGATRPAAPGWKQSPESSFSPPGIFLLLWHRASLFCPFSDSAALPPCPGLILPSSPASPPFLPVPCRPPIIPVCGRTYHAVCLKSRWGWLGTYVFFAELRKKSEKIRREKTDLFSSFFSFLISSFSSPAKWIPPPPPPLIRMRRRKRK